MDVGHKAWLSVLARFPAQFDAEETSESVRWLPLALGARVRVVLSMIDATPQHVTLTSRTPRPAECRAEPLTEHVRRVRNIYIRVCTPGVPQS